MRCTKLTILKVKCKICNLVIEGYESDLRRHLHLKHNFTIKKGDTCNHFIATDSQDTPIITTKAILKQKNKIINLKRKQEEDKDTSKIKNKSINWRNIIKTPCGSK